MNAEKITSPSENSFRQIDNIGEIIQEERPYEDLIQIGYSLDHEQQEDVESSPYFSIMDQQYLQPIRRLSTPKEKDIKAFQ